MHAIRVSLVVALASALCIGVASGSDANLQEPIRELDRDEVLARIAKMPIREADGVALLAIQALAEITGDTRGYRWDALEALRNDAIERWVPWARDGSAATRNEKTTVPAQ